jgi:hypothetical protein
MSNIEKIKADLLSTKKDDFKPGDRVCFIKQNVYKTNGPNVFNCYLGIVSSFGIDNSDESFGHQICHLFKDSRFHVMPMITLDTDVRDESEVKSLIESKDFEKSLYLLYESTIRGDDVKLYPIPEQYFPRLNEIVASIKRAAERKAQLQQDQPSGTAFGVAKGEG